MRILSSKRPRFGGTAHIRINKSYFFFIACGTNIFTGDLRGGYAYCGNIPRHSKNSSPKWGAAFSQVAIMW